MLVNATNDHLPLSPKEKPVKLQSGVFLALLSLIGSAHAGTYTCDVELKDGSKTKVRGVIADSESHAARIVKEGTSSVKWINCMRVN